MTYTAPLNRAELTQHEMPGQTGRGRLRVVHCASKQRRTCLPAAQVIKMSTNPPPGPGGVGRRIEEAVELIEMELRHAVAYVNDAVVPQVRKESISAMRNIAESLQKLADRVERGTRS